jgi:hypothetical protein
VGRGRDPRPFFSFVRPVQPSPAGGEIPYAIANAPKPRRIPVSGQHVNAAWQARLRVAPIASALTLTTEGLVLGAGTVLVAATAPRRLTSLRGQEPRVLALLAAAYGKPIAPSVLGNIEHAAKAWRDGDDCLAHIHLAHTGLRPFDDSRASAYRLFLADGALRAGASPRDVFKALHLGISSTDAVGKYSPDQPRVPKGSGRTSGEWTDGEATGANVSAGEQKLEVQLAGPSTPARMPPPAAGFLGELGAAVAAFGLLFIPSPNNIRVEGDVPEIPGLRYSWNRDETLLRLTYEDPDGNQHTFSAQLDGDVFRDPQGRVIGRVLSGSNVAIDAAAVSSDLVDEEEPRLCPDPVKDRRTNDKGLAYENYIKTIVNPENPTPPYMGYQLSNIARAVTFDDCEHSTGTMVEIKDGYAKFLESDWGKGVVKGLFLKQAFDQIQTAGTRPVRWYFSQEQVAEYAGEIFREADRGRENIEIIFEPLPEER